MKLSQFKFKLSDDKVALYPPFKEFEDGERIYNRDDVKMMVMHRTTGEIEHHKFSDLLNFFDEGDSFVFNDTRVFPARLYGNKEKTGARIEVFLMRELNEELHLWDVLVDPARKIRIGNKLYFGEDDSLVAEVIDNTTSRGRTLRFLYDGPSEEFRSLLYSLGEPPIPNDIRSRRPAEASDAENFQTVYATNEGAVTAPTAGLHFTKQMMKRMEIKGINQAFVTLHAGLGNFRSIDVEDLTKHKTDSEEMFVTAEACDLVNSSISSNHKVCAVGTTTIRALETAVGPSGLLKEFNGWTNKFIFPPYTFHIADALLSNFQLPMTIMMMVQCSFGEYEKVMKAYNEAVKHDYRFGTYGDVLLIID